jgi:hypothetical protein
VDLTRVGDIIATMIGDIIAMNIVTTGDMTGDLLNEDAVRGRR